jgi:plastocyanin
MAVLPAVGRTRPQALRGATRAKGRALVALCLAAIVGPGASGGSSDASATASPVAAGAAARLQAGGIRGRLDIRRLARPAERRPEVADPGAAAARDLPDLRRGVVYLETAPRAAFDEREPGRATMDQYKERFVPHVLAVMVGTFVDFPNSDRTYHNVFSLSKAKRFDLGRYAAGRSKAVRMDRPGVVRVFCDIHSHMSAFILVFNHPFFSVTNPDGRFELPSVPAGTYTVVGWYEGEPRITRSVSVPPSGWAEVDLVVP